MRQLYIASIPLLALAALLFVLPVQAAQLEPTAEPTLEQPALQLTQEPVPTTDLTLEKTQAQIDLWLNAFWTQLQATQDQYVSGNGIYWQALRTHESELNYQETVDAKAPPDQLESKPSDVSAAWPDVFPDVVNQEIPCVATIDIYDGPDGQGYVLTCSFEWKGQLYVKSLQSGPERWRSEDWHKAGESKQ